MDFMEGVLLLGIVGGAVMALVTFGVRHLSPRPPALIQMPPEPLSTDLINMAHIRVVGIGGLGLLIVTLMMAFVLPELAAAVRVRGARHPVRRRPGRMAPFARASRR